MMNALRGIGFAMSFARVPKSYRKGQAFRRVPRSESAPTETKKALISQGFEDGGSVEIRTLG